MFHVEEGQITSVPGGGTLTNLGHWLIFSCNNDSAKIDILTRLKATMDFVNGLTITPLANVPL